ncbi:amino_acid_permease_-_putative [Leishmania major strain Friedlin]|nr:amino_acid_permease_-_putative [Leishmania major strain Friedlin]
MHGRRALLSIRNQSVAPSRVPAICKEGLILTLQEQHITNDDTAPYRPVTLTSNLCKLPERLSRDVCGIMGKVGSSHGSPASIPTAPLETSLGLLPREVIRHQSGTEIGAALVGSALVRSTRHLTAVKKRSVAP